MSLHSQCTSKRCIEHANLTCALIVAQTTRLVCTGGVCWSVAQRSAMRSVLVVCAAAATAAHSLVLQGYWGSRQVHPSLLQSLLGCHKFLCPQRMSDFQCVAGWPLIAFAKINVSPVVSVKLAACLCCHESRSVGYSQQVADLLSYI
jgi:hypothetical protein